MSDLVRHALSYAGLGLAIFPVDPRSKRPLTSQLDATTDLDMLEEWWDRWPDALIGHRIDPGVLLLDIDPRHEGRATWAALKAEMNVPPTRAHLSGRGDGGGHVWFKRPTGKLTSTQLDAWAKERGLGCEVESESGHKRWISGIDLLRHEHRYTILPPSPHPATGKPYRWVKGRGLNVLPADLPPQLAELLTRRPETEAPTRSERPIWRDPDSIADWFSSTHSWVEVLKPHRWQLVNGDGDSDGSEWRHPAATNEISATVRHECLFVYSTNTPFEVTETDDPHGYTRYAAWAVLDHAGDQKQAGRVARAMKRDADGPGVTSQLTPERPDEAADTPSTQESHSGTQAAVQRVDLEHLESFWTLRPILGRIRDFARSRRCSPWAMLGVVLARVAAATPPFVTLPPLVGSHLSLNLYVVLVGGSGAGKDAAISAGKDCIDVARHGIEFRHVGLGSGEGILDQFVVYKPPDKASGEEAHIHQHTTSVLFTNPEIETVGALKGRSNATLMPMLRDAWMGSGLGFAYANTERRLTVAEHRYRLCLILGSQPTSAGALLDEAAVGTPQRFVWLPVHDPAAPDAPPAEPEMPDWHLPAWPAVIGDDGKVSIGLCDEAVEAIDAARLARLRGDRVEDIPSGHDLACREKVAALLAILDGRSDIDLEDWSLAGIIQTVSTRTRDGAKAAIDLEHRRSNRARGLAAAERQVVTAEVVEDVEDQAMQRVCRLLADKLTAEWVTESRLKNTLPGRDRKRFPDAMERLEVAGLIETKDEPYGSKTRTSYRLKP